MMNSNCPKCGRPIDPEDDVVMRTGPFGYEEWHEECAPVVTDVPEVPEVEVPQIEVPQVVVPEIVKEVKVDKPTDAEVTQLLYAEVMRLRAEMDAMRSRPVPVKKVTVKGQPRPNVHYTLLGFPSEGFPPQCLRVMRCLAQAAPEGGEMNEVFVWNALMGKDSTLGAWPYRQSPFYIFKYYRSLMIQGDYLLGPFAV